MTMEVSKSILHQIPCPVALKSIVQKLKDIEIRRHAIRVLEGKYESVPWRKRVSAKVDISYGYHAVEKSGSVVVYEGEIGASEAWLFGAFDRQIGDGVVARYLQSYLLEKNLQPPPSGQNLSDRQIARKAMQAMKNAYHSANSSVQPQESGGSAYAVLVNGSRLVSADFGGYRTVLCRRGKAVLLGHRRQKTDPRLQFLSSISGKLFGHSTAVHGDDNRKRSYDVGAERLGPEADFLILASCGLWEVLGNQEAVSLIRHIEDPQRAAKCLADEAVVRMTKTSIVCVVIRIKRPMGSTRAWD